MNKVGHFENGTLWDAQAWKAHASKLLSQNPYPEDGSLTCRIDKAIREGMQTIMEAPDTHSPEQMKLLAEYMAANVMALGLKKKPA